VVTQTERPEVAPRETEELDLATVLQALSDPIRLRIVSTLADGSEMCCGAFNLPITKSTSSHHFRVLREAGVISTRTNGKTRINTLRRQALDERFPGLLDAILSARSA
jgi:DNA-binding transcriptional ArsR family regulator